MKNEYFFTLRTVGWQPEVDNHLFLGFTTALCSESESVWQGINLKCIDAYAVLEWENDMKFHVFATEHKANT
jgi:hypothetical protein